MNDRDSDDPTTTHSAWGAGDPHLLVSNVDGDRSVFPLVEDTVTIGSGAGSSLLLEGTDPVHATILHDDRDEYVLTLHGAGSMNASRPEGDEGDRSETLRTGARFVIGEWTCVFSREEFADHGRPHGGREGGEFSDQDPQPRRPEYDEPGDPTPPGQEVRDG